MNQKLKGLCQLVATTFGVGCNYKGEEVSVNTNNYTIKYQDAKVGKVIFTKSWDDFGTTMRLKLGNEIKDKTGVVLTAFKGDGLVIRIKDFYGSVSRGYGEDTHELQKRALHEERFAKADKIFASFTSKGKLADLIKKAEDEWEEKYNIPQEGDILDHYLN